jgi:hypothetical protein
VEQPGFMMEQEVFLFSYFKGHGDGLHLAFSEDGYRWQALRDDTVIVHPKVGIEKIMRDPCLYYHRGKFHLVWTSGWTEKGIGYCSTDDLIHWSVQEYLPVMGHEEKARNCWAPEIFFDETCEQYLIYWSSTVDGKFPETQPYGDDGYNHRIYYVTTKDFKSFSETKLLYDGGFNSIDANIVKNDHDYILFIKNETLSPPQKNIRVAKGKSPYDFGQCGEPITLNHYWAEGPTGIKVNGDWVVYFDKYKINEIGAVRSKDLRTWEDVSKAIQFPKGAQHGYVLKVPLHFITPLL